MKEKSIVRIMLTAFAVVLLMCVGAGRGSKSANADRLRENDRRGTRRSD